MLPDPPRAAGAYRPGIIANGFVFLSGFGPRQADGTPIRGVVGADMNVDEARAAAVLPLLTKILGLQETAS